MAGATTRSPPALAAFGLLAHLAKTLTSASSEGSSTSTWRPERPWQPLSLDRSDRDAFQDLKSDT